MTYHVRNSVRAVALGLTLVAAGCTSASSPGAEATADHPSQKLANRLSPAGVAMASIGLFNSSELDEAQQHELISLRTRLVAAQRTIADAIASPQHRDELGAVIVENQQRLVDQTLVGVLELRATLSPSQSVAFMHRAKRRAHDARRQAAETALDGDNGRITLLQTRAEILEELAGPRPDATKLRALGSAFVASHAIAPDMSGGPGHSIAAR